MNALFFDLIGKYHFLSEVTASDAKGSVGVIGGIGIKIYPSISVM